MSLKFALLGLLAEQPSSGYHLAQRFEQGIGTFAWTAKHSQIYPELAKLTAAGLVHVVAEGPRGRRVYDVTETGRESLRGWLLAPQDPGGTVRNEFVLRLFLLSALPEADAHRVLDGVAHYSESQIEDLEGVQAEVTAAGHPGSWGPSMAAMFGVFSYRAARDWARWAQGQLSSPPED